MVCRSTMTSSSGLCVHWHLRVQLKYGDVESRLYYLSMDISYVKHIEERDVLHGGHTISGMPINCIVHKYYMCRLFR